MQKLRSKGNTLFPITKKEACSGLFFFKSGRIFYERILSL